MYCKNCGNQVGDGMKFCPECGAEMASQALEEPAGKEAGGKEGALEKGEIVTIEDMEQAEASPPETRRKKYNIGHFGVLIASLLTLVAAFIPNRGELWSHSILEMLSINGKGDGRTYVMILAMLLIATIVTACLRKNMLMVIGSIVSTVWILYMYTTCGESFLYGMGLLLFLLGGILLVISAVAALIISRKSINR